MEENAKMALSEVNIKEEDKGVYGKRVKVKKPLLIELEHMSVNEFLYLHNLSKQTGVIVDTMQGRENRLIYLVSYGNIFRFVSSDDIMFLHDF